MKRYIYMYTVRSPFKDSSTVVVNSEVKEPTFYHESRFYFERRAGRPGKLFREALCDSKFDHTGGIFLLSLPSPCSLQFFAKDRSWKTWKTIFFSFTQQLAAERILKSSICLQS